ncbi:MAG: hypothetical protein R2809_00210 [Flavobacteriales bacterium]
MPTLFRRVPSALEWFKVVWALLSYAKEAHPWDVNADGEVYYVSGGSAWIRLECDVLLECKR